MITSAQEFLALLEIEEPTAQRIITDSAPEAVWLELITNHPETRLWVARNKCLPDSILIRLAHDEDENVRWWIAFKRRLPLELFEKLGADHSTAVRERIAFNEKTPAAVLQKLSLDEDTAIARKTQERLNLIEHP